MPYYNVLWLLKAGFLGLFVIRLMLVPEFKSQWGFDLNKTHEREEITS